MCYRFAGKTWRRLRGRHASPAEQTSEGYSRCVEPDQLAVRKTKVAPEQDRAHNAASLPQPGNGEMRLVFSVAGSHMTPKRLSGCGLSTCSLTVPINIISFGLILF